MNKIGFIGTGNMATAIIKGLLRSNLGCEICGFDVDNEKLSSLAKIGVLAQRSIADAVNNSKFVFLSVKPQNMYSVLTEMKPLDISGKIVISIAAGISADYIRSYLGENTKIALVMPNTPLLLGEGASALSFTDNVAEEDKTVILKMFSVCGVAKEIPLNKMNEIIAVNGSSPAFIYLFTKAVVTYAEKNDIDTKTAAELFCQTLIGSAKMMESYAYDLDFLIKMVSSPGGTTISALNKFQELDFEKTIIQSMDACTKRAYELANK